MKGHISATDEQIASAYKDGKFIRQICREMKVGIHRVRKVVRSVPA